MVTEERIEAVHMVTEERIEAVHMATEERTEGLHRQATEAPHREAIAEGSHQQPTEDRTGERHPPQATAVEIH